MDLADLGAVATQELLLGGRISAEELTRACLERIQAREEDVRAWTFLDPELALSQAREADQRRRRGEALGPLHGLPVGVKDIFDTRDMPTEDGTVLHQGRTPSQDATAVARLREAGAVILGKTVTTELATYHPGPTRNPHNPEHTPGGSSSGSAAAVAAGMCPLALGTQTNGSVIRPAAYCGVFGYKPSFGLIPRHRVLQQSRPLDQVGVFARNLPDLALLAETLMGYDPLDPDTRQQARPALQKLVSEEPPVPPRIGLLEGLSWEQTDDEVRGGFAELAEQLGDHVERVSLPPGMEAMLDAHRTLMEADLALSFEREYQRGREQLSSSLQQQIERGQAITAVAYHKALNLREEARAALTPLFQRLDALITPAVTGAAPLGLEATGSPVFCTPWTFLGAPALNLPLLQSESGLPIGVQLVAGPYDDARLLRTASWLLKHCD